MTRPKGKPEKKPCAHCSFPTHKSPSGMCGYCTSLAKKHARRRGFDSVEPKKLVTFLSKSESIAIRKAIKVCGTCFNLGHQRPKDKLCVCGRPWYEDEVKRTA